MIETKKKENKKMSQIKIDTENVDQWIAPRMGKNTARECQKALQHGHSVMFGIDSKHGNYHLFINGDKV